MGNPGTRGTTAEFERLLEVGLAEYGAGRLDEAMEAWQAALFLRPDNAQARGYLDFVRDHYRLIDAQRHAGYLQADPATPFELGDDDAYLDYDLDLAAPAEPPTRVDRSELVAALAATMEHIDEGWSLDDEQLEARAEATVSASAWSTPATATAAAWATPATATVAAYADGGQPATSHERTSEAAVEPTIEPTAEAANEPAAVAVEPTPEAQVEAALEPTAEAAVEPTVEAAAEPTVEAAVEPTAEAAVESTVEAAAAPTVEAAVEPTVEAAVEPPTAAEAEPTPAPAAEPMAEAAVEPTVEAAVVEPTPAPAAEPMAEAAVEPTVEAAVEPTVEAAVEPTVEAAVEAAVELPSAEATFDVHAVADLADADQTVQVEPTDIADAAPPSIDADRAVDAPVGADASVDDDPEISVASVDASQPASNDVGDGAAGGEDGERADGFAGPDHRTVERRRELGFVRPVPRRRRTSVPPLRVRFRTPTDGDAPVLTSEPPGEATTQASRLPTREADSIAESASAAQAAAEATATVPAWASAALAAFDQDAEPDDEPEMSVQRIDSRSLAAPAADPEPAAAEPSDTSLDALAAAAHEPRTEIGVAPGPMLLDDERTTEAAAHAAAHGDASMAAVTAVSPADIATESAAHAAFVEVPGLSAADHLELGPPLGEPEPAGASAEPPLGDDDADDAQPGAETASTSRATVQFAAAAPDADPGDDGSAGPGAQPFGSDELTSALRSPRAEELGSSSPTIEFSARAVAPAEAAPLSPYQQLRAVVRAEIEQARPAAESVDDAIKGRVRAFLEYGMGAAETGDLARGVVALRLAIDDASDHAAAHKQVVRARDAIAAAFQRYLGDPRDLPALAMSLVELGNVDLDPRAAFMASRIDGTMTWEEILDVAGMPRLEALTHLVDLVGLGVLAVQRDD
jgi:hypothetical protein